MVYITVRYGESQREIFNPNCKTNVLLKSIKTKCKCDREADIELSDESGNIKNLRDPSLQHKYASELLDEREIFVLLKVEKTDSDNPHILYKPLLQTDDGVLSDEFLARLAVKGNETQQKRVRSSTRRRDKPSVAESSKDHSRQNSREKNNDKLKTGSKSDKRLSARSKR
ncbi:CX065-like protein [Mya arenaria]|uniref:CX065-like protein n=1 Tax=Mya arenaria TaxID=6604 RepID=A0ABY7ERN9_MYAAR|nr:uncharacterized protein CXorf65 homolog [Mya arenaria]XP_052816031.1 uncharacterized protein CXorf65 homolog [Mya arenaria]WAR11476.1 CX065-like protein [Mya arenaria]